MHALTTLFPDASWQPAALEEAVILTPLGGLTTQASIAGQPLLPSAAKAFAHASGARRWVWSNADVRAELLLAVPELSLPPGMRVDGCYAFAWRLRAATSSEAEIRCAWAALPGATAGAPESGEDLEAQAWYGAGWRVSVGTPDLGAATEYLPGGFRVHASLVPAETFGVHFVAAWSPDRAEDDSAWFAVDCSSGQILAGISAPAS